VVTGVIYGRGTPIPDDYAPAKVDFMSLTQDALISWVVDLEDQEGIQEQLDAIIFELQVPTDGSGLPWQDSFPLWVVGIDVTVGEVRIYENIGYEVIQAHHTQATWAPPATPSLWKVFVPVSEGPQPWVQPLGSQDAYAKGIIVTHTDHLWTSLVDANVWEPTTANSALWQDDGVSP
jgi:hypothetical protein